MALATSTREEEVLRQLHQHRDKWRHDAEALARQIGELQMLLRQTTTELDRLSPRSNQAAQRLRDMEAHIECYSRSDIKDLYVAAHEAQMRLFMMQMQQEQIEHKLRSLTAYRETITLISALSDEIQVDEADAQDDPDNTVSPQESISRIIQAQEDERRRISRQIHDGPAQLMANLVLRAEICERLADKDAELMRKELIGLKQLVANGLAETRQFIFDLRPMILDDLGLAPTLRRYFDMLSDRSTVPIRLSVIGGERRLDPKTEIALFRVAQEAVRNALKHGEPSDVAVTFEVNAHTATLTVEDDGRGCEGALLLGAARQGRANGLARMEEYARSVGGTFDFHGEPARGCRVTATFPVDNG